MMGFILTGERGSGIERVGEMLGKHGALVWSSIGLGDNDRIEFESLRMMYLPSHRLNEILVSVFVSFL